MASRAILRRSRLVKDYASRTTPGFQWLGHCHGGFQNWESEAKGFSFSSGVNDDDRFSIAKQEFRRRSPMGIRWIAQSVRTVTTATAAAKPPDDEENERRAGDKRKQASPEDCDQAVQGLSTTAKAAKAKKLQESQKVSKMLKKVWATFLGIGPAFRAVASMSRFALFNFMFRYLALIIIW